MNTNFGELNRKPIFILGLLLFIVACRNGNSPVTNNQKKSERADSFQQMKATERVVDDSIRKNQELIDEYERFTSSPLVMYDNFSFKTGYFPIDKIKERFDNDSELKVSYRKDIELGDCGYCMKLMSNDKNEILHYIKGDCGEYGFSNDQYYLQNDSLKLIREFSVGINTWPSESEQSTWKVKETIHVFSTDKVLIKSREFITPDFMSSASSIKSKPFKENTVSLESVYEEKKKEMISSLEMKTLE